MDKTQQKPDYYSWNASELFCFLQNNHLIPEEDNFDDWMYSRPDMLKLAEEFFEQ